MYVREEDACSAPPPKRGCPELPTCRILVKRQPVLFRLCNNTVTTTRKILEAKSSSTLHARTQKKKTRARLKITLNSYIQSVTSYRVVEKTCTAVQDSTIYRGWLCVFYYFLHRSRKMAPHDCRTGTQVPARVRNIWTGGEWRGQWRRVGGLAWTRNQTIKHERAASDASKETRGLGGSCSNTDQKSRLKIIILSKVGWWDGTCDVKKILSQGNSTFFSICLPSTYTIISLFTKRLTARKKKRQTKMKKQVVCICDPQVTKKREKSRKDKNDSSAKVYSSNPSKKNRIRGQTPQKWEIPTSTLRALRHVINDRPWSNEGRGI